MVEILKKLNFKRSHAVFFVFWQISLCYGIQLLYGIFLNLKPVWTCQSNNGETFRTEVQETVWTQNCSLVDNCKGNLSYKSAFYSAVEEFDMICGDTVYRGALISTLTFVGTLIGAFSFGQIGDTFGRRKVSIFLYVACMIVGCSAALVRGWVGLAVSRTVMGALLGGIMNVPFAYTMEMIGKEQRIFLRSFITWGNARMFGTLICFLIPTWRLAIVVLSVAPGVLGLIILIFLAPESTKWLQTKKRFEELRKTEEWLAKFNKDPVVEHPEDKAEDEEQQTYTFLDLFANKQMTIKTITLMLMWFAASLSSYASDLNSRNLAGNFWVNQFLFSLMVAVSKPFLFLLDSFAPGFNRRLLHQIPQTTVIISFVACIFIVQFDENNLAVSILNQIGHFLIEVTWDACYVCAAEGFPTVVRTIGIGSCSVIARIGGIAAPQMAYLAEFWLPAPYLAVVVIGSIALVVSFLFLEDTKGKELEGGLALGNESQEDMASGSDNKMAEQGRAKTTD